MRASQLPDRRVSPWFVLGIVSLPVFIGALDLTIISAVLPEVIISLKLPVKEYLDQASWAVNGYLLAYAISMTFTGRLSDMIGRRAVYIGCLLIFIAGSYLVTAYDSSLLNSWVARFYNTVLGQRPPRLEVRYLYLVITGRIIQALGAGAMVPVTFALVGDLFDPRHRARPLGVIGAVDTVGWVLGHLYGGVMVRLFGLHGESISDAIGSLGLSLGEPSWETLFILNIPISFLALLGAWWALKNVKQPPHVGRFDIVGTFLIAVALIGFNLGLGTSTESVGSAASFEDLQSAVGDHRLYFMAVAAIAFILFLVVESRLEHPLLRLGLFRARNFSAASGTNLLVGFCLAIGLVSAPLLVNIRAETPTSKDIQEAAFIAGLLLSGLTIPMALAAVPGGWLSERYGYRAPTVAGMILATFGFVLAGLTWRGDTSYWLMGAQMALVGVGLGLTISPVGTVVLNDAHEEERGVTSALILILRLIGMSIAISSLTIYSLNRVDSLVAAANAGEPIDTSDTGEMLEESVDSYFEAAVRAIRDMQLIGAAVSGVGVALAMLLRGGQTRLLSESPGRPQTAGPG